jgi:hypothetical protein
VDNAVSFDGARKMLQAFAVGTVAGNAQVQILKHIGQYLMRPDGLLESL